MCRCISCDCFLINPPRKQDSSEENMCSKCLGLSLSEYNYVYDHEWAFEDAQEGLTMPMPFED